MNTITHYKRVETLCTDAIDLASQEWRNGIDDCFNKTVNQLIVACCSIIRNNDAIHDHARFKEYKTTLVSYQLIIRLSELNHSDSKICMKRAAFHNPSKQSVANANWLLILYKIRATASDSINRYYKSTSESRGYYIQHLQRVLMTRNDHVAYFKSVIDLLHTKMDALKSSLKTISLIEPSSTAEIQYDYENIETSELVKPSFMHWFSFS